MSLPACVPACLRACVPACLRVCLSVCLSVCSVCFVFILGGVIIQILNRKEEMKSETAHGE